MKSNVIKFMYSSIITKGRIKPSPPILDKAIALSNINIIISVTIGIAIIGAVYLSGKSFNRFLCIFLHYNKIIIFIAIDSGANNCCVFIETSLYAIPRAVFIIYCAKISDNIATIIKIAAANKPFFIEGLKKQILR